MAESRLMTLHEQLQIGVESIELRKQGKIEEARRLARTAPLAPHLADCVKRYLGAEALLSMGWNLAEAEQEYGPDWLSK